MRWTAVIHTMLKPLRYVFFRILAWKLRHVEEDPLPVLTASLLTTVFVFLNFVALTIIVKALLHRPLAPLFPGGHLGFGAVWLVVMVMAYRVMTAAWIDEGGYSKLIGEFPPNPALERCRTVLFWSYVTLSIVLPIALAFYVPDPAK